MERVVYLTQDDRRLYKEETNRHHTLWRRDFYTTPSERKLRDTHGMVLRLTIGVHKELHEAVPAPPKPNPNLQRDIVNFATGLDLDLYYDRFTAITDYLTRVMETGTNQQNAHDAGMLAENFQLQAPYIDLGRVAYTREAA